MRAPAAELGAGGGRPLYRQVEEALVGRISSGQWGPGAALPGEPSLAAEFGVSISTLRAAVGRLVDAGVLERIQGRGTFVASRAARNSVYQFFHLHPDHGQRELPVSELVSFGKGMADDRLALELGLADARPARRLYLIRNLLRMGGEVVQLSDIVIPAARFPGLTARRLAEGGATLYGAYQAVYGITVVRTEDVMKAAPLERDVAALFGLPRGEPALKVLRTAFTFHDIPVEVRTTFMRTDRFHYRFHQGA